MWNMQDFFCETITCFLFDFGVKFNFELIVFPYRNIFNFLFTPSYSLMAWEICPGSFFFPLYSSSICLVLCQREPSPPLSPPLLLPLISPSPPLFKSSEILEATLPTPCLFSPLSSSLSRASDDLTCRVWGGLFVIPSLSHRGLSTCIRRPSLCIKPNKGGKASRLLISLSRNRCGVCAVVKESGGTESQMEKLTPAFSALSPVLPPSLLIFIPGSRRITFSLPAVFHSSGTRSKLLL